jgi:uncharacterized protein YjbI with pentapeptide repeats
MPIHPKRRIALSLAVVLAGVWLGRPSAAQDMLQFLDLKSDEFTKAEMTRADVEARLAKAAPGEMIDLSARRLNGLDLSGLDLRRLKLQSARINKTNLKGANLDGVVLDQAWGLDADLSGASLKGASLFATQLMGARMENTDFTGARIAADMSRSNLTGARFDDADLSADMKNQSMGLMRGVFKSANLESASFAGANLARVVLEYATLKNASLKGANLAGAELGGADLTGADVTRADFAAADVNSARLVALKGKSEALNLDKAANLDRARLDQ